ncbi:FAD-dependent oxidoreductase [Smaragdicoccus niigatensis]|nr:FAD-dependent oxidoreductase [Smaragdicoccus niigatensis]
MEKTTCLIAGGGPAGLMLGLILARGGVEVTLLEKHGDFLRDFRGDTVHPTTLDLLDELGLSEEFADLPANHVDSVQLPVGGQAVLIASLRDLPGKHKYIAMVPQWDLLDLLAQAAKEESTFTLRMSTPVTGLIRENGRVAGVTYRSEQGEGEIRADLVIACDGRESTVRAAAGLDVIEWPVPFDAWWFRIPRHETDPAGIVPVLGDRRAWVMLDRFSYWQIATLIAKGSDVQARQHPVREILESLAGMAPWLSDRVDSLDSWDDVKLLHVRLDRLKKWHMPGLLCIGDAAHAMSPAGGVGINLAIQDAVAAARILAKPLKDGTVTDADLAKVQRRRIVPTIVTQGMQRVLHERGMRPALEGDLNLSNRTELPRPLRVLRRIPVLRSLPPFLVARGVLPEHAPKFARR